jgi:KaiC/GvpD/RAD55 family RecA-like ATPase
VNVVLEKIPAALRACPHWILWRLVQRDGKETKFPMQVNGKAAESNNPATWCEFTALEPWIGGDVGPGFVFSADDEFCGIDLDGCRDPDSGEVAEWAKEILRMMDTYAEISPSLTGIKLFLRGSMPNGMGRKQNKVPGAVKLVSKAPQVELYDRGRFFTVTGMRLGGLPSEPQERQKQLDDLLAKLFVEAVAPKADFRSNEAVMARASLYLRKFPPAISGQKGHDTTFRAACILVLGFGLNELEAMEVLREWNKGCLPPWSERELLHKVQSADKQGGERNYLRNTSPERWEQKPVPEYKAPPAPEPPKQAIPERTGPRVTTLADAAKNYLEAHLNGGNELIATGLPDVDYALGGGIAAGEVIILAARPSHGKSAVAMQVVHNWTAKQMPCLVISEEMSALALGKRAIQFFSETPQEHWRSQRGTVQEDLDWYESSHAPAIIVESCGTTDEVVNQIDKAVAEHGVQGIVVDYAQLLRGTGKSIYEQVTNTSKMLTAAAKRHNVPLLLLAQMGRGIESRPKFVPQMSDLKESGQLEQDADVILFLLWPHRIDPKLPADEYRIFVAKNRNREINKRVCEVRFMPSRQKVVEQKVIAVPRHNEFDNYNDKEFDA